jgi:molybdopterin-binding protein
MAEKKWHRSFDLSEISTLDPKHIFSLVEGLRITFKGKITTTWNGNKVNSILTVKIDNRTISDFVLEAYIDQLKLNVKLWNKLNVFKNNKGVILFEIKPYDYGYMELADFMKKNKIKLRSTVYYHREKIEYMYRSPKWIYYRFKEVKK